MPVHADVAARFRYLDGLSSLREAYADPVLIQRIRQFETWEPIQPPPAVHVRDGSVPGPHGPVPVRIYTPSEAVPDRAPCLVWLHGGGFIGGAVRAGSRVHRRGARQRPAGQADAAGVLLEVRRPRLAVIVPSGYPSRYAEAGEPR
jgi:acetyl esterase/lipase